MKYSRFHVYLYGPSGGPLRSRFDDVAARLAVVDRLHFEPDGSLVWVGPDWQIDGMIYDQADIVQYAELKGHIPLDRWQSLIRWIAEPDRGVSPDGHFLASIWRINDQSLHDLQAFEKMHWPGAWTHDTASPVPGPI